MLSLVVRQCHLRLGRLLSANMLEIKPDSVHILTDLTGALGAQIVRQSKAARYYNNYGQTVAQS